MKVHQTTVESYLESIVTGAIENTASQQAKEEIEVIADQINDLAYELEDKYEIQLIYLQLLALGETEGW